MDMINQLFGVAGKNVLVTGGSKGIGRAITEAFVKAGAQVFVCSRDLEAGQALARELQAFGTCSALACNIASADDRLRFAAELSGRIGALHVMVNNAGALWAAPLADYPESGWDKTFDLNVKGTFFLIQALLPLLYAGASADDPGRIINVGSINAFRVPEHETYAYGASKAALHQLTRHLAAQLAPRHITANVLAPGLYPSKMQQASIARDGLDALVAPIPLKRLASAEDMAGAAIYLASRAGAYVTASILPVDGGLATTL